MKVRPHRRAPGWLRRTGTACALLCAALQADPRTSKEAMRPVQFLVGEWKVLVTDEVRRDQSWEEEQTWEYRIEGDLYALRFSARESRVFKEGVLTYDLARKLYRLELVRASGAKAVFEGPLAGRELHLEEPQDSATGRERLTFQFLRDNRFLAALERRDPGARAWRPALSYQFTKKGVPFVRAERPKCVVTGGTGDLEVYYQGKTYYVC
ncbi:MAG: hypothetical protein ACK44W_15215 [Planctomycetota bacterium]